MMEKETIMEPKMFTADEIDSSFSATGWSPDESECMALNPAPDGKGVVVSALEKIGDSYAFAAENTDGIAHYTEKQRKHIYCTFRDRTSYYWEVTYQRRKANC